MRSARYFAADHGIRLTSVKGDSSQAPADPKDADEAVDTPPSRGGIKPKADWFLHDDRDEDPANPQNKEPDAWDTRGNQTGWESRRGSKANPGDRKPGYTLPLVAPITQWQYIDPEGKQQGPFDAKKLLNWVDLGYFGQTELQVRQQGTEEWGPLAEALPKIRQQAAGDPPEDHDRAKEPLRNSFNRNNDDQPRGRGRGRNFGRGRRFQQEDNDLLPVMPEGKRHPAEALLSPREEEDSQSQRRNNRRGADPYSSSDQPARGRGRGGRGRGAGRGYGQDQEQAAPGASGSAARVPTHKAAWNLFSADSRLKADEPKWKYIDPDDNVQGPFTCKEMHQWWEGKYLQPDLPICGMNQELANQDIPKSLYKPLGQLLRQCEQGQRFRPVQQSDLTPAAPQQPAPTPARVPLQLQPRNAPRQRPAPRQAAQPAAPAPQVPTAATEVQPAASAAPAESAEKAEAANSSSGSSNDDAESVVARSKASGSESDEEEGELRGRTAATDEDSDFEEPDQPSAASVASEPAQPSSSHATKSEVEAAPVAQSAHASPSPAGKSGEAAASPSPEPAQVSTDAAAKSAHSSPTRAAQPTQSSSLNASKSPQASPSASADPAAKATHSSPLQATSPLQTAQAAQASASTASEPRPAFPTAAADPAQKLLSPAAKTAQSSPARAAPPTQASAGSGSQSSQASPQRTAAPGAKEGAADDAGFATVADVSDDDDESAGSVHDEVPETSGQPQGAAAANLKAQAPPTKTGSADGGSTEDAAVRIEEISQAEAEATQAQQGQHAGPSSPQKTDSPGLVQSVVDAARSLLSSKPDKAGASSQQDEEDLQDLSTSRKSFVIEPETSESEGTASIANSDDRALDQQDSGGERRDIAKAASFHSVDQDVADLQSGMQNVTIEEPAEDTAADTADNVKGHVSNHSNQHSPRRSGHSHADPVAEVDVPTG